MSKKLEQTERLLDIMKALRDPQTGCPWDVEQTHKSLKKYVIEEAYEVAETLQGDDEAAMISELGDLLFQVVFHAEIGRGEGRFDFDDISKAVSDKMIARHPHVFADAGSRSVEEQRREWEAMKEKERGEARTLDGVSLALPALSRALKLQKRAARVGFDWDDRAKVWDKINEEFEEFKSADDTSKAEEYGDILFALVNLGRHYGIDAEDALARTNAKFKTRFEFVEDELAREKKAPQNATLEHMELLWQLSKSREN